MNISNILESIKIKTVFHARRVIKNKVKFQKHIR